MLHFNGLKRRLLRFVIWFYCLCPLFCLSVILGVEREMDAELGGYGGGRREALEGVVLFAVAESIMRVS